MAVIITVGRVDRRKNKAICIGNGACKKVVGYFKDEEAYQEFLDYMENQDNITTKDFLRAIVREVPPSKKIYTGN